MGSGLLAAKEGVSTTSAIVGAELGVRATLELRLTEEYSVQSAGGVLGLASGWRLVEPGARRGSPAAA